MKTDMIWKTRHDGQRDLHEPLGDLPVGREKLAGLHAELFVEDGEVDEHDAELDHAGDEGRDRRAADAQGRKAEVTEDQGVVQKEVDDERGAGVDEADERRFHRAQHAEQDLRHGEEDVGERHDPQVFHRLVDDRGLVREDREDGAGKGEGHGQHRAGEDHREAEGGGGGALDVGDVPLTPEARAHHDRAVRDAVHDHLQKKLDLVDDEDARDGELRGVPEPADHDVVEEVDAVDDDVLPRDGKEQPGEAAPEVPPGVGCGEGSGHV